MLSQAPSRRELAHRSGDGIEVTLVWAPGAAEEAVVCVRDTRSGVYFEIPAEPDLALDVYHHPFAYRRSLRARRGAGRDAAPTDRPSTTAVGAARRFRALPGSIAAGLLLLLSPVRRSE